MSLRAFIGWVALLLLVGGGWLLFSPVTATDSQGYTARCGSATGAMPDWEYRDRVSADRLADALNPVTGSAGEESRRAIVEALSNPISEPPECADAIKERRIIAIPIVAVAGVALLGAVLVRRGGPPPGIAPSAAPTRTGPPGTSGARDDRPKNTIAALRRRPRWWIPATAAVVALFAAGAVFFLREWRHVPSTNRTDTSGTSTTAAAEPGPGSPPGQPLFSESDIDEVLLTPTDIMKITSGAISGTFGGPPQIVSSIYGMTDDAAAVRPRDCVGVVFGAQQRVYAESGFDAVRSQTVAPDDYSSHPSTVAQQTVVVFPSDEQARAMLKHSLSQWSSCSAGDANPDPQIPPYQIGQDAGEGGWAFDMTSVEVAPNLLAVKLAGISNLSGTAPACQAAMGVRANVLVQTKVCVESIGDVRRRPTYALDPSLSNDYATLWAESMLARVRI